ncbi:hypothetical protein LHYA1_G008324 [Lachnellula hyalina]|uniref:Rhodopsin domain-containing protein n=1 Tax=Lachnellula hyalina TaxID=1316788 RepID=A0A8H8TXW8_9HELO|nr:uncharacterized protein LHYA1_G008324 [Lachnellula hyalina]TVY23366.1 hypothetical protein LHYA1_G008324 [Lachnellula hyalina]
MALPAGVSMMQALEQLNSTGRLAGKLTPEYFAANESWKVTNTVIALAVLEVLFIVLFFFSRIRIGTANGLDTYLMVPAFIVCFAHLILCWLFVKYAGLGKHWYAIEPHEWVMFLKLELSLSMLNPPALTLPKLAILCLYLRVFTTKPYRWAAYFIGVVLIITWIVYFCVQMVMCVPFAYQWDKTIPNGKCLNQFAIFVWIGLPSIATDLMIIILPLPIIWRLQTSINQKIGLTITFLTGSVGIVTAIVRFAVFLRLTKPELDLSWTGVDVVLWATIEPSVYLIAACLPSLRSLLNPVFKEFDMEALRTRFRIKDDKAPPNDIIENIHLSGITAINSSTAAGPLSPSARSGFKRLNEPAWPNSSFYNGNKDTGMSTCYRERDSEDSGEGGRAHSQTELQGESQYSYGIVVQKAFTISTEPIRK